MLPTEHNNEWNSSVIQLLEIGGANAFSGGDFEAMDTWRKANNQKGSEWGWDGGL